MSETITPVAPPNQAAPPANAPPPEGEPFAPVLAAVAQDAGPPGDRAKAQSSTRSAKAEGAKAGSDSSEPEQTNELPAPAQMVVPTDAALALVAAALPLVAPPAPAVLPETRLIADSAPALPPAPLPQTASAPTPARGAVPTIAPAVEAPAPLQEAPPLPLTAPASQTAAVQAEATEVPAIVPAAIAQPELAKQPGPKRMPAERVEPAASPASPATAPSATKPAAPVPKAAGEEATPQSTAPAAEQQPRAVTAARDDAPSPAPQEAEQEPAHAAAPEPAAPAPQPDAAPTTAPVAAALPPGPLETAAPPRPQAAVQLHQLTQAAEAAIRLGVRDNQTFAQISVHPEELGPVQITLRYDDHGGVTASIHAGSAEAARTLADAAPDLRRALETQGLSLLALDVHSDGRGATQGGDVPDLPQGPRREASEPTPEPTEPSTPVHVTNQGAHVDVLA